MEPNALCHCGVVAFSIHGAPRLHGYCHCTICQAFNEAPFADITLFRQRDVTLPSEELLDYQFYTSPPMVRRGKCKACGKPAVETLSLPLLPKLVIVPTANIRDAALVPPPSIHMFYHRRQAEVQDNVPKYEGYLRSQLAFGRRLIGSLLRRSGA